MTTLRVLDTPIRLHDGLYSLNDLHKASGCKEKHKPARFLRNDQTKELIAELKMEAAQRRGSTLDDVQRRNSSFASKQRPDLVFAPVRAVRGGQGGSATYACKELVYAYAMWISARFHLAVIRAFDAMVNGQALPATTPLADRALHAAINRRAHQLATSTEPQIREQLTQLAAERLRRYPRTRTDTLISWINRQTPALPAPEAPPATLPPAQQQALLQQITPLINLFHPLSDHAIHLHGVIRILRGQQPGTGLPKQGWTAVISTPRT